MVQFESEELKTMTRAEAETVKLGFGKHKNKTLGQIFQEVPSYIEWLADNANDAKIKTAADLLLIKKDIDEIEDTKHKASNRKVEPTSDSGYIPPQEELPWK